MSDLNNLGLKANPWDVDFNTLPEGFGAQFARTPQPGTFKFQMPSLEAIDASFEEFDHPEQGKRLRCSFREVSALQNLTLGEPYNCNLSNVGRLITPRSGKQPFVISDLALLLKAVGCIPQGGTLDAYKEAVRKAANTIFVADHILTANCSKTRDRSVWDEGQGKSVPQPGVKGCGSRFRQEAWDGNGDATKQVYAIPRDPEGKFLLRFECLCGAEIRAWGQLQGFRSAR